MCVIAMVSMEAFSCLVGMTHFTCTANFMQANDLAHKAVLKDMIPLVTIKRDPTPQELQTFQIKYVDHD